MDFGGETDTMKIGKVSENVLKRTILKGIKNIREEVLIGAALGEDCAVLELKEGEVFVTSTDPITGTSTDIGRLAVHVAVNDLAAEGAEPIGLMTTALLPADYKESWLKLIMEQYRETCVQLGIEPLGGHTEVTAAVNRPVLNVTGIGKAKKDCLTPTSNAKPGMDIIVTKWVGLEGTSILAKEKEKELLTRYPRSLVEAAQSFDKFLSVLPEARIAVSNGAVAMHDITEGGIFGALWELAGSAGVGIKVDLKKIPICQETVEVCEFFNLNPYCLISSGSMLIVAQNGYDCVKALEQEGIHAVVIGKTTDNNNKAVINGEETRFLEAPKPDELYKVL